MIRFKVYFLLIVLFLYSCSKNDLQNPVNESELSSTEELLLLSTEVHSPREAALFQMINAYRISLNMNPFIFDNVSLYYAKEHSAYMASKGITNHAKFGKRAEQIAKLSGAELVAENVAKDHNTIGFVFDAWLESKKHRRRLHAFCHRNCNRRQRHIIFYSVVF